MEAISGLIFPSLFSPLAPQETNSGRSRTTVLYHPPLPNPPLTERDLNMLFHLWHQVIAASLLEDRAEAWSDLGKIFLAEEHTIFFFKMATTTLLPRKP